MSGEIYCLHAVAKLYDPCIFVYNSNFFLFLPYFFTILKHFHTGFLYVFMKIEQNKNKVKALFLIFLDRPKEFGRNYLDLHLYVRIDSARTAP